MYVIHVRAGFAGTDGWVVRANNECYYETVCTRKKNHLEYLYMKLSVISKIIQEMFLFRNRIRRVLIYECLKKFSVLKKY